MKKIFVQIFAVFMAVLVFYGGAGINVISYCCKDCRSAGIEALLNDKCCEIHNHSHEKSHEHTPSKSCCSHTAQTKHTKNDCYDSNHSKTYNSCIDHTASNSCNMERIDFDWNSQNTACLKIYFSPNVYELFSDSFSTNSLTDLPLICENNAEMPNGPPLVCPRDYLSILTVLLI